MFSIVMWWTWTSGSAGAVVAIPNGRLYMGIRIGV